MKETENKVLLVMYYIGKLVEFGFVERGGPRLTPDGFECAMCLLESGLQLDENDVSDVLRGMDVVRQEDHAAFLLLIMSAQKMGVKRMLEMTAQEEQKK